MSGSRLRADEEQIARPLRGALRLASARERSRAAESPHAHRFRGAIVLLAAIGVASIVTALILLVGGGAGRAVAGSAWSQWQPPDNGTTGAQEIADYLSPYYRASSAYQLAVVTTINLSDPSNPVQIVLPSSGSPGGVQALPASSTYAYNLCGLNSQDCSIGVGTPSASRLLLLRREALELALYTFKYIAGAQTVVAILPPGHTTQGCTGLCPTPHEKTATKSVDIAVAFDRSELQPWLDRPLRDTLPEALPPTVAEMPNAPEAELVSVITGHGLFQAQSEQSQSGGTLIVLNPEAPQ